MSSNDISEFIASCKSPNLGLLKPNPSIKSSQDSSVPFVPNAVVCALFNKSSALSFLIIINNFKA